MGNLTNISAAIQTILSGVQQSGADAFVDVVEYPSNQFDGFPSVTIVPADIKSQLMTVQENFRTYAFEVAIYVSVANLGNMESEFIVMRTLVDAVLDALDQSIDLNDACDFLVPVPMKWTTGKSGSGDALIAPIFVQAQKLVEASS